MLPQFERILDLKMGQIKTELKQEMIGTLEEMMVPFKKQMIDTVEAMKIPLKSELKEELTDTVEAEVNANIMSASTSMVRDIIIPDLDQKMNAKVEAMKINGGRNAIRAAA